MLTTGIFQTLKDWASVGILVIAAITLFRSIRGSSRKPRSKIENIGNHEERSTVPVPKLEMEISANDGITRSRRLIGFPEQRIVGRALTHNELDGNYKLQWFYHLTIWNNSPYNAYKVKLESTKTNSGTIDFIGRSKLDEVFLKHRKFITSFVYEIQLSLNQEELQRVEKRNPMEFKDIGFILHYENGDGKKFTTVFNLESQVNDHSF